MLLRIAPEMSKLPHMQESLNAKKIFLIARAPSQDSDRPTHPRSLSGPRCLPEVALDTRFIINITKTCLYNFDPLKPYFYIVKLGFTRVYIIFLISAQVLTITHNLCFEQKYEKYLNFLSENFQFFGD